MIKKLNYGTTNNKKKWCLVPLFCLLLMFACFFCSFNVLSVNAESVDIVIRDDVVVNVNKTNNNDRVIADTSTAYVRNSISIENSIACVITSSLYSEIKTNSPSINLYGFVLFDSNYNGGSSLRFSFNDLTAFTYCSDINSCTTYNYYLNATSGFGTTYYINFVLPFSYSMTYDYNSDGVVLAYPLIEEYIYSGDGSMLFGSSFYRGSCLLTDYSNFSCSSLSYYTYAYVDGVRDYCYDFSIAPKTYNVKFYDYDNTLLSEQSVVKNTTAIIPNNPIRNGFDFIGWSCNVDGYNINSLVDCDLTFTAKYNVSSYNVIYKDYDGSIISSQTIDYGSYSVVPSSPNRVGYTFDGWTSSVVGVDISSPIMQNVVFTAKYNINRYRVTFIGFDGVVLSDFICDYGSYVNTPNAPSIVGYTFNSWSSNNNISVDSAITDNVVFTANYTRNVYVVRFVDENGNLIDTINIEHGLQISSSSIPVTFKYGYSFVGWISNVETFDINSQILCDITFTKSYEIIPEFWEGVEYAKNENYENGFNDGVSSVDTSVSYNNGYQDGYNYGFDVGESYGLNTGNTFSQLMYSIIDAPFNVLSNAFDFEILGINLSYFLIAIVSLLLVFFVIRKLM